MTKTNNMTLQFKENFNLFKKKNPDFLCKKTRVKSDFVSWEKTFSGSKEKHSPRSKS